MPELVRRGVVPDVLTDQTSAHDTLNGYVPLADLPGEDLRRLAPRRSRRNTQRRALESIGLHVRAMLDDAARGGHHVRVRQ